MNASAKTLVCSAAALAIFCSCLLGCAHGPLGQSAQPPFSKPGREIRTFTTTCAISELPDTYCIKISLTDARATENTSGEDRLSIPELCIPKNDRTEHTLSISSRDPAPANKPLPSKNSPLPPDAYGIELRFQIKQSSSTNVTAEYTLFYRDASTRRENRWTGSYAFSSLE